MQLISNKEWALNRVIVFGGTGYVGGHVSEELAARGYHVTIYDLVRPDWLKENINFLQGSLDDFEKIKSVTKTADIVYHFAGIADIEEATSNPLETVRINVLGTTHLLEACSQNKVKKFVLASTVYVYSDKGSFYRITKQTSEQLVEEYSKRHGMDFVILRYGSLYGGRAQKWNGLRRNIEGILQNNKIILKNRGRAKRDYIHIYDAMRMSVDCLDPKYNLKSLLITGAQSISHGELVNMIGEILGKEVQVEFCDDVGDHYDLTPYRYHPKAGMKMTTTDFIDFGQGILEVIQQVDTE